MEIKSDHPIYKAVLELFEKDMREDEFIRRDRMRSIVRCHQFWEGLQYTYWDDLSSNWRLPPDEMMDDLPKVMNYYKGHGESVISALTASIPGVIMPPDDADNPYDVETAHAYSQLAKLLYKHNNAKLLATKAMFTLFNEDYVMAYIENEADEKYGESYIPQFREETVTQDNPICENCGAPVPDMNAPCPECGGQPVNEPYEDKSYVLDSYRKQPKSRTKIHILGQLFVKIPYFVSRFEDVTYAIWSQEYHYTLLRSRFPEFREHINPGVDLSRYDSWGRMEYKFYMESNITTLHRYFCRPCRYEGIEDEEQRKALQSNFPKGIYASFVGGQGSYIMVDIKDEAMDDCWQFNYAGTSTYLHDRPIGEGYLPVQEMQNELANLAIQTVEYGIPETFVDSQVLDMEKYAQREAMPGMMTAAEAPPGRSLSEGFFMTQAARLGDDVEPLTAKLETAGQFIVGDPPSVSGVEGKGSRTYGEYSLSRTQGLQRLGIRWGAYSWFWAQTIYKACVKHAQAMIDGNFDENMVTKQGGNFSNNWIRRAQLSGTLGDVEPEAADKLPVSVAQQMDIMMQLLQFNNPGINATLFSADNSEFVAQTLGYPEIKLPGELQRQAQLEEIQEMLMAEPIVDPMTGTPMSSVQINPNLDDDVSHIDVTRSFLLKYGKDLKVSNPAAYLNIMAHLTAHVQNQQMAMLAMAGAAPLGGMNANTSQQPVAG